MSGTNGADWRRELLLIDLIDACPLCRLRFPTVCDTHYLQAHRLAHQRQDAAGARS